MRVNLMFFLMILLMLSGCKNKSRRDGVIESEYITIAVYPETKGNKMQMSKLYEILRYIPLETNNDYIIANINKIIHANGHFYIYDDILEIVFCFSEDGAFRFKIDGKGKGPGEYNKITDFTYYNDKIYILDVPSRRLLVFDEKGNFIHDLEINIYASNIEIVNKNIAVYFCDFKINPYHKKQDMYFNILIAEDLIKVCDYYLPYSERIKSWNIIGKMRNITRNNNKLTIWQSYDDYIYRYYNEQFEKTYFIDFQNDNQKIAREILTFLEKESWNPYETQRKENKLGYCNIIDVVESSDVLHLVYSQGNYFHFVYYFKNTGYVIDLSSPHLGAEPPIPLVNDIDGVEYYPLMMAKDDIFYTYAHAYDLMNSHISNDLLDIILVDINEFNNPVIVMLKIKQH